MKKNLSWLLILCLILSFALTACNGGDEDEPENTEVDVALSDFYKVMHPTENGSWECPGQYATDVIGVYQNGNRYQFDFIQTHVETSNSMKTYDILSVKYDSKTMVYKVSLKNSGEELTLELDFTRAGSEKIILAPSFSGTVSNAEYMYNEHLNNGAENSNETEVSLDDFYNAMHLTKDGYWECAGQFTSDIVDVFQESEGGEFPLELDFIQTNPETASSVRKYEVVSVTYNKETKVYKSVCKDLKGDVTSFEFDMSRVGEEMPVILTESFSSTVSDAEYVYHNSVLSYNGVYYLYEEGLDSAYASVLTLNEDMTFSLKENLYEGYGIYSGTYDVDKGVITCMATKMEGLQGFKGDDVTVIEFEIYSLTELISKTELCMTRVGTRYLK